jgi:cold shock protein
VRKGTVKWFNDRKGYGFLLCEGLEGDVFVHHEEIQSSGFRTLSPGERVVFELEVTQKGSRARKVVRC